MSVCNAFSSLQVGKGLSKDEEVPKLALQQWWTLIDLAELKQSSVSFFDVEKPESAVSRWARAKTRAAKVILSHIQNHFQFYVVTLIVNASL